MAYIDINDMLQRVDITKNFDIKTLNKYIAISETLDLRQYLSDVFLNDLSKNYETKAEYIKLLNGGEYTCGNDLKKFEGMKAALVFFVYSRIISTSTIKVTQTGVVQKESDYSSVASDKAIVRQANEFEAIAKAYMMDCIDYLRSTTLVSYLNNSIVQNRTVKKFNIIGD